MQTQIRNVASHFNDQMHAQAANHNHTKKDTSSHIDLLDELMQQDCEDIYVDDSKDDLSEWQREEMDANDELMLGSDSSPED